MPAVQDTVWVLKIKESSKELVCTFKREENRNFHWTILRNGQTIISTYLNRDMLSLHLLLLMPQRAVTKDKEDIITNN